MGSSNATLVMTLVNSIIGVSILAMPFCYKQCGIVLASLILIFSNLITRLSCHFLLKSAIMTRRRTFELLAFHALGPAGKIAVELSIISLMIGTCIAFFVVMGDLSPQIIGSRLELKNTSALRPAVLLGLALFVVLPLGLLRNVDSLSSICTASFLFYLFLVFKVFIESTDNLFASSWIEEVHYWRPAGILQCLPIFSMALSCQTQLLEVFDSVANCTLDRINLIVKSAVNLCTALYISVGFFGYVGYYKQTFSGNLLLSFSESNFSEFIKFGFVLSVAVTFPLVIFPCRASLHSLLFKKGHVPHYELVTGGGNHIPEAHFKCLTFFIITVSLIVGLLAPNIEIVLGLLGSTIGVVICFLCPPVLFICISSKATTEKILAQFLFAIGVFIMIMGTYANLYLSEPVGGAEVQNRKPIEQDRMEDPLERQLNPAHLKVDRPAEVNNIALPPVDVAIKPSPQKGVDAVNKITVANSAKEPPKENRRVEPPGPLPPLNKEPPEQMIVANGGKPVELPVPKDPLGGSNEKLAAQAATGEKKERVELPAVPVASLANGNNAAAPAALSPAPGPMLKNIENGAASDGLPKKPPPPPAAEAPAPKSSLSSDEKRLLSEQKAVLQRMRAKKQADAQRDANVSAEKKVAQPPVKADQIIDVAAAAAKSTIQRAQEKVPLPLLVQANAKEETNGGGNGEVVAKRDILQDVVPDREKRDLYFITNASAPAAEKPKSNEEWPSQKAAAPSAKAAAAKELASSIDENPTCEKDGKPEPLVEHSKVTREPLLHDGKSKSSHDENDQKSSLEIKRDVVAVEPMKKLADKKQNEVSSVKENEEVVAEKIKDEDNILIAPSKLSDPVVRLAPNIPIDVKPKPVLLNVVKPMSRDLKAIKDEPNAGTKKK